MCSEGHSHFCLIRVKQPQLHEQVAQRNRFIKQMSCCCGTSDYLQFGALLQISLDHSILVSRADHSLVVGGHHAYFWNVSSGIVSYEINPVHVCVW